MYASPRSAFI